MTYNNSNTGMISTNVQTAIDELYNYCLTSLEFEWNFTYSGNIEPWIVPYAGYYQLEVWGAQGGKGTYDSSGVTDGTMENSVQVGNGKAKITYLGA